MPRGLFLFDGRLGPADDWRDASPPLGVPGPKEDWRRLEEVAGMERWCGFSRRRFPGSVGGDRFAAPREGFRRLAAAVEGGRDVFSGDG